MERDSPLAVAALRSTIFLRRARCKIVQTSEQLLLEACVSFSDQVAKLIVKGIEKNTVSEVQPDIHQAIDSFADQHDLYDYKPMRNVIPNELTMLLTRVESVRSAIDHLVSPLYGTAKERFDSLTRRLNSTNHRRRYHFPEYSAELLSTENLTVMAPLSSGLILASVVRNFHEVLCASQEGLQSFTIVSCALDNTDEANHICSKLPAATGKLLFMDDVVDDGETRDLTLQLAEQSYDSLEIIG